MTIERAKIWSEVVGIWATTLGLLAAGGFGLHEYLDKAQADRVKETLDYVHRFDQDAAHIARLNLDRFSNARMSEIKAWQDAGGNVLYENVDKAVRGEVEQDVTLVASFFDNVKTCICADICDRPTALAFFGKAASDYHGLFHPYLAEQAKLLNDPQFGASMRQLASAYRAGDPAAAKLCSVPNRPE